MTATAKEFSIDIEKGTFRGPSEYMKAQGNQYLADICSGKNEVFNMFSHESPNLETAIVVFMQTDYAGWKGFNEAQRWTKPE
jgi:hypothetical protein